MVAGTLRTRRLATWGVVFVFVAGGLGAIAWGAAGAAASGTYAPFHVAQIVPSLTTNSTAHGFAGYVILPTTPKVTDVKASWDVPKIASTCPSVTQYALVWVGMGGMTSTSTTLEAIGTATTCSSGSAAYAAWYQYFPSSPVTLSMTIHPGDNMHGEVKYNTSSKKFTATLKDRSTGKSFFVTKAVAGAVRDSAEWIVSAPSIGGVQQPLANFGSAVFTNASVTIAGHTHSISGFSNFAVTMWNGAGTRVMASVGVLKSSGTKFTVTWKSSGP